MRGHGFILQKGIHNGRASGRGLVGLPFGERTVYRLCLRLHICRETQRWINFKILFKQSQWSHVGDITILAQCSRACIPSRWTGVGWSTLRVLGCQLGQSLCRLELLQELRTSCGSSSGYFGVSNITKTFTEHAHLR